VLLCILMGAVVFFATSRAPADSHANEFMGISSYGTAQKTSGIVRITMDWIRPLGASSHHRRGPYGQRADASAPDQAAFRAAVPLRSKSACCSTNPNARECDITPDYRGFLIPKNL
jgi:hypothetical protein